MTCGSKKIILGVLDLSTEAIETPETIASRIRPAVDRIGMERILVAPDCVSEIHAPRRSSGKLKAMCDGAIVVRSSERASRVKNENRLFRFIIFGLRFR